MQGLNIRSPVIFYVPFICPAFAQYFCARLRLQSAKLFYSSFLRPVLRSVNLNKGLLWDTFNNQRSAKSFSRVLLQGARLKLVFKHKVWGGGAACLVLSGKRQSALSEFNVLQGGGMHTQGEHRSHTYAHTHTHTHTHTHYLSQT
jgi:hypothetical protein